MMKLTKCVAGLLVAACVVTAPCVSVEAKAVSGKVKVNVTDAIKQKKAELRKDFLRKHGATEEDIQKLDKLHFFDFSIKDLGKVDVGTYDEVICTFENMDIDINIYFNFITINK